MILYVFFLICFATSYVIGSDQGTVVQHYGPVSAISEYITTKSHTLALSHEECAWLSPKFDLIYRKNYATHTLSSVPNPASHDTYGTRVTFSRTGRHIFAASLVNQLFMLNFGSPEMWVACPLSDKKKNIQSLSASPHKENTVAYTDTKDTIKVYDAFKTQELCSLEGIRDTVIRSYVWHTQNDGLLIRSDDQEKAYLSYWDMRESKPLYLEVTPYKNENYIASSISISPNGQLCSAINDKEVAIIDFGMRKNLFTIPFTKETPALCAGFIDDANLISCTGKDKDTATVQISSVSSCDDARKYELENTIRVQWDTPTRTLIRSYASKGTQLLRFYKS